MKHRARDVPAEEPEFLWHDRLPVGHMTVVAGAPGMGKSTLGYRIAADCDVPTLFITNEEVKASVWRPRLAVAGMDAMKAWHHSEVQFSRNPADMNHLRSLIERYGVKLIVVDPAQSHIDVSLSHDQAMRTVMEPYLELMVEKGVALVMEAHVLRDVNHNASPELAFPTGLRTRAKALYLFGKDPTLGADPDMRIMATAKFSFGKWPESRRFEFATGQVQVKALAGGRVARSFAYWIDRGEVKVSAKMLLVTLAPESKDRKSDRVAWFLMDLLRKSKDGVPVSVIRIEAASLDPPTSWRTVERVAKELGIEREQDPAGGRKQLWKLPEELLATLEEADTDSDIVIEEVDQPDDTFPEDWVDGGKP